MKREELLSLPYYEKASFTGSANGFRYKIEPRKSEDKHELVATVWQGIYASDHTPAEEKETFSASFSEEGLVAISDWLNEKMHS